MATTVPTVHAPRGTQLTCKDWPQEAAFRMIQNNLDPDVAEKPAELIVYGGTGKAARSWDAFREILACLKKLKGDETLLVQSGKAVGVFQTHPWAPRVLIANSLLVPHWANWEHFRKMEALGLTMYGQMTAGSWIYIGTQGILQGTYETFSAVAEKHFGGSLAGRLVLTAGLGGMGGAQPLAVTFNEGVVIAVEVDRARIDRRLATKYADTTTDSLDEALRLADEAKKAKRPLSIALLGNAADVYPEIVRRGVQIDIVTDQTSAHDLLGGYVPRGIAYDDALALRKSDPERYIKMSAESIAEHHVPAMIALQKAGSVVFDYGNNIRGQALAHGCANALDFPGFVPAYIRPLFCEGKGPFRWVALSGDPADIHATDEAIHKTFPEKTALRRWIQMAHDRVAFQGLPARICWLGHGERDVFGLVMNDLVRRGKVKAPIVIGRDHLDGGSVASPYRETEAMKDGSDTIADWPILNALLNASSGASWVSVHHGGGVGIGYSLHAGMVVVADGTKEADERLYRVLTNDPGTGVMRHADAGYDEALDFARTHDIHVSGNL